MWVNVANVEVVERLHLDEVLGLADRDASVRDPSLEARAEVDAPRGAAAGSLLATVTAAR